MGYRFTGQTYLTDLTLPNFSFHVTAAYAFRRTSGVKLGKLDFLRHLGPPTFDPDR
ncbi:DUF1993 family protein [Methylobacterium goesingense]|uniref:DUF1993 family protein n=1 Tax=Methylobacterium goesingense TaxID=243690 RepID=A0ABV2LBG2_9HYPH|nr:DUF1993 family protein [Methylobacterium goesingense]GJD73894.1 hypothetical protein CFIICLFH_2124 [Methylobacterium goesingense]